MCDTVYEVVIDQSGKRIVDVPSPQAQMRASAASIRRVLYSDGNLEHVEVIATSDPDALIEWEYRPTYNRLGSQNITSVTHNSTPYTRKGGGWTLNLRVRA